MRCSPACQRCACAVENQPGSVAWRGLCDIPTAAARPPHIMDYQACVTRLVQCIRHGMRVYCLACASCERPEGRAHGLKDPPVMLGFARSTGTSTCCDCYVRGIKPCLACACALFTVYGLIR
jgi:hypothetical protein